MKARALRLAFGFMALSVGPAGAGEQVAPTADAVSHAAAIHAAAARYGVPAHLIEAIVRAESNFDPSAVSPKGARGLMQLMPGTATMLGVKNPFDVRQNLDGGVRHLVDLLHRFSGNLRYALAAYNAGEETVRRHGGVPPYPETMGYVERIVAAYQRGLRGSEVRPAAPPVATAPVAPAVTAVAAVAPAEPERSVMYRYEAADGTVIFTNVERPAQAPAATW